MRDTMYYRRYIRPGACICLFFAGMMGGIFFVQGQEHTAFAGIFSEYFLNQYAALKIDYEKLFRYIGSYRFGQYALVICCGALPVASYLIGILVAALGMVWGTMISISTIRLGLKGVLICMAGVIPQIFFYVPAFGWIFIWIWKRGSSRKKYLFLAAAGILFLAFGILTEVYINPLILQQILRKM